MLQRRQTNQRNTNGITLAPGTPLQPTQTVNSYVRLCIKAWYLQRTFCEGTSLSMGPWYAFPLHRLRIADIINQVVASFAPTVEISAHWISSYLLGDKFLRVPSSPEEAFLATERVGAYLRRRYPDMLLWTDEGSSGAIRAFT